MEKETIGRIGIYGDIHLSSRNYGAHRNYPEECMEYFRKITSITEEQHLTHLIGLGDLTFGKFHTLEFRRSVKNELARQYKLVNGNRYELKGNHDISSSMTERDYYVDEGIIIPSQSLTIGSLNISMVDYGKSDTTQMNIVDDMQYTNVILAHDFYKFSNSNVANFGAAIILDNMENWFGADILICGHVHKIMEFDGAIAKDDMVHELKVIYPGCMTRPSFREGYNDEVGQMVMITVYSDGSISLDKLDIPLWSIGESFNVEAKQEEKQKKQEKINRVDISDIVKQLDAHDRSIGNPEDIIQSLEGVDERYKAKAIQLLKEQ